MALNTNIFINIMFFSIQRAAFGGGGGGGQEGVLAPLHVGEP